MTARPSGAAITVSGPFRSTVAPLRCAAWRARSTFAAIVRSGNKRRNSPSWGVSKAGPWMAANSSAGALAKTGGAGALRTSRPCLAEDGDGVGLEPDPAARRQGGQCGGARALADAGAGTDQDGVAPLIL